MRVQTKTTTYTGMINFGFFNGGVGTCVELDATTKNHRSSPVHVVVTDDDLAAIVAYRFGLHSASAKEVLDFARGLKRKEVIP